MGTDFQPNHPDITSEMWPRIDGVIALNRGVPGSIITAKGVGEASPVDSNDTAEGRHNNRRVVIKATR